MIDKNALHELLDTFVAEFEEGLGTAEQALLALERTPDDDDSVGAVFRVVHTIKGNAGIFDFAAVTALAHAMEDLLDRVRQRTLDVTPAVVTLLLQSLDALGTMLRDSVAGPRNLLQAEQKLLDDLRTTAAGSGVAGPRPQPNIEVPAQTHEAKRTLRVDVARLDRLLDLSGEIGIARGRVNQLLADANMPRSAALEVHRDSMLLHMEMQELIMKLRMVPVGPTFRQLLRTVRDTARALGKQAQLRIEGEDVEVDMAVVEQLKDPLMHMVRNSIDHGIETPAERERAGKTAAGTLVVRSFHEAGSIIIELEDDGAGVDRERILQRARALGLVDGGEVPADADLFDFLFRPGFSTATLVSDVSGRGVGLDVVRRNIEAIQGSVSITSSRGRGTKVSIRLPLTLAIIDGLQVEVRGQSYIIPMEAVVEALELRRDPMYENEPNGLLPWRGTDMPFVRLRHRLECSALGAQCSEGAGPGTVHRGPSTRTREHAVVVRYGDDARAALIVDELVGECQTVVKPLAKLLQGIAGVSGSAILPDGRIAFIVDVPDLLQSETARTRRRWSERTKTVTEVAGRRPRAAIAAAMN